MRDKFSTFLILTFDQGQELYFFLYFLFWVMCQSQQSLDLLECLHSREPYPPYFYDRVRLALLHQIDHKMTIDHGVGPENQVLPKNKKGTDNRMFNVVSGHKSFIIIISKTFKLHP